MGKFCKCPLAWDEYNIALQNVSIGLRIVLKQYEKKNIRNNSILKPGKKLVCICHDS